MPETYEAVLKDGQLQWTEPVPEYLHLQSLPPIKVQVTLLEHPTIPTDAERGRRMAAALEKLAAAGRIDDLIPDPVAWQREQRQDRPLPGRD